MLRDAALWAAPQHEVVALTSAILRLFALLPLAAALPAAAQTKLAQQCAAFGEAQYRKLSPSVDRVMALDFPPPALERVDAKVGSQTIAAALTLRGRLTYRTGLPFETQFVCLLDAAQRPLFFYALPTLATRSAPTPVTRGGAPAPVPPLQPPPAEAPTMALGPQAALPTPEPARPSLPASAVRLRGLARDLGGRLQFLPCDGAPLPLEDRTPDQELTQALRGLTAGQNGRPMFVEIYGGRETGPGAGISALELRRAAVETAGCRERFDQREWLATGGGGNEASWRLEVTSRDMLLSITGGQPAQRIAHGGPQKLESAVTYAAADNPEFTVLIDERRCIDPQSGSLFAYTVEVRSEGRTFVGCAVHNPAMPAP
jgi:uncharacterized membrane protein